MNSINKHLKKYAQFMAKQDYNPECRFTEYEYVSIIERVDEVTSSGQLYELAEVYNDLQGFSVAAAWSPYLNLRTANIILNAHPNSPTLLAGVLNSHLPQEFISELVLKTPAKFTSMLSDFVASSPNVALCLDEVLQAIKQQQMFAVYYYFAYATCLSDEQMRKVWCEAEELLLKTAGAYKSEDLIGSWHPEFFIRYWAAIKPDKVAGLIKDHYGDEWLPTLTRFLAQYNQDTEGFDCLPDAWISEMLIATIRYEFNQ